MRSKNIFLIVWVDINSFSSDNFSSWRKSNFVNFYGLKLINHDTFLFMLLLFLINIYDIMPWFVAIDEKGLLCQSRNHYKWQGCRSNLGVKQGKSITQGIIYLILHIVYTLCPRSNY